MIRHILLQCKLLKQIFMKTIFLLAALLIGGMGLYAQNENPARETRKEVLERRERRTERKLRRIERRNPEGYGVRDNRLENREERINRRQKRVERRSNR